MVMTAEQVGLLAALVVLLISAIVIVGSSWMLVRSEARARDTELAHALRGLREDLDSAASTFTELNNELEKGGRT